MGEDGAALSWEADGSRTQRREQPVVHGGGFVDCPNWQSVVPALFGNWRTAFRRFSDWRKADVFKRMFDALPNEPDMEYAMIDATIVRVHRHGQGPKGGFRARP